MENLTLWDLTEWELSLWNLAGVAFAATWTTFWLCVFFFGKRTPGNERFPEDM